MATDWEEVMEWLDSSASIPDPEKYKAIYSALTAGEQAERRVAELEARVGELEGANAAANELIGEYVGTNEALTAARAEADALRAQVETLTRDLDLANQTCEQIRHQRDQEVAEAQGEAVALRGERDTLARSLAATELERDSARLDRETLTRERQEVQLVLSMEPIGPPLTTELGRAVEKHQADWMNQAHEAVRERDDLERRRNLACSEGFRLGAMVFAAESQVKALREALGYAAGALEQIAISGGRNRFLPDMDEVRTYAGLRAVDARAALASEASPAEPLACVERHPDWPEGPHEHCPTCDAPCDLTPASEAAGTGERLPDGGEPWVIECTKSGTRDWSALWWAPNRRGYTTDLSAAGRYSREEAESQARHRDIDRAYPLAFVQSLAKPRVDRDTLHRVAAQHPSPAPETTKPGGDR